MAQARTEFAAALNQIASEKGVEVEVVLDAIRVAALAAYKKDLMLRNEPVPEDFEEFTSAVDPATGEISVFHGKDNVTPPGFARIAASIAKQVIMQKLNEAERGTILAEYEGKVGTVISGTVQRQEGNTFFVDLGRAEGVLPPSEQVRSEMYHQNQRLKFLVKEIREGGRGSEVVVSRADPNLVKALFALEVPEIQSGAVEVKVIAREAGSRTKIAAVSTQDGVDPVGSLVGQKGVRVQAVIGELGEEKIDIISYSGDSARFIAAALSPAKEIQVKLNEKDNIATVTVPQSQLSLAIGKGGQNVRLAAKLTGWKIDIEGAEEPADAEAMTGKPEVVAESESQEEPKESEVKEEEPTEEPEKEQAKEAIEKEVAEAEENAVTVDEKEVAEEAGEVLEKALEEENPEQEEKQLEEAVGETEEESGKSS
ncbi:transcription termination factor NusA [Candidatus Daviesbacteria bacterium RIFCSPHIGHO2_02_FULL_41_10]|uniref:Transcription termination/antitermination protein NusA n=1 Tax=Candidatus Daviesbacteria bacterium RIFCSPHIGHO2_02_FULL_41_10 TaxID=1797774 RepID=A0A1F5JW80_9BACT|nr:MAG: transcription termination factor NusA [Candidatus Daviesbacteria bacterium RIFCSPHIGHO2_02_FULL_41_10]OGE62558.1 MAG: transcription termination factor NusA [Candidatus Daviesbacteria bacterium RIFCSPLOWO2_01_FULL_41_32]